MVTMYRDSTLKNLETQPKGASRADLSKRTVDRQARRSHPVTQGLAGLPAGAGRLQRKCGPSCGCAAYRAEHGDRYLDPHRALALQRVIGNRATARLLTAQRIKTVIAGPGEELDVATRVSMERRFGTSFADVRVHRDSEAEASANALDALAYTAGSHIVFAHGRYDTSSADGQHVLAHELTHVVQQRGGPVSGVPIGEGVTISEPGDSFERDAEERANDVVTSDTEPAEETTSSGVGPGGTPVAVGRLTIQRDGNDRTGGTTDGSYEQIATDQDIAYMEQLYQEGQQQAGLEQTQDQATTQALRVQPLVVQRWSVWTCFGDKANVAAAIAATIAAGATAAVAFLAPDPTTITKWVSLGLVTGIIAGIAWIISAVVGLRNCYRAQDDAAQHQREIDSLQRQIDQLQKTLQKINEARGGGPAPAPAGGGE